MTFEEEVFKKYSVQEETLIPFGFTKEKDCYIYKKDFMNFQANIYIQKKKVYGRVIDTAFDEEYVNFRIEKQTGEFVAQVRKEYEDILVDIRNHCFEKEDFMYAQSNRISKWIQEMYGISPEFLWANKNPDHGVFRNARSKKWFGLVMNVDKEKLIPEAQGEIEILNVKLDEYVSIVLDKEGIYPAYHQSKKNWVSVILDDTLSDEEILALVQYSYSLSDANKQWLLPANPKYYDVVYAFEYQDEILWKQSASISVGDIVYLYVGAPYSCILYQCEVIESDIPYNYFDKNISMKKAMKIQLKRRYKEDEFPFSFLKEFGVNAIRGPRSIPQALVSVLNYESNE